MMGYKKIKVLTTTTTITSNKNMVDKKTHRHNYYVVCKITSS